MHDICEAGEYISTMIESYFSELPVTYQAAIDDQSVEHLLEEYKVMRAEHTRAEGLDIYIVILTDYCQRYTSGA